MSDVLVMRIILAACEFFIASTLIVALAWLASFRETASARHLVWAAALTALVLLPVACALVPGNIVFSLSASSPAMPRTLDVSAAAAPSSSGFNFDLSNIALGLAAIWMAGLCLIALRSVMAAFILRVMKRDSEENPFDESELPTLANGREYRLLVSRSERGPVTWGFLRPVVLLPRTSLFWPGERLHAVLRHELAHINRYDSLTQMLSLIACAFYWPNPLVWLGARAMRRAAEIAADDAVILSGIAPSEYADELLHVAAGFRAQSLSTPLFMAAPSALEARLKAVLSPTQVRSGVTSMDILKISGVALLTITALVLSRPSFAQDVAPAAPVVSQESAPAAAPVAPAPPADVASPAPSDIAPPAPAAESSMQVSSEEHKVHGRTIRHMRIIIDGKPLDTDEAIARMQPEIDKAMAEAHVSESTARSLREAQPKFDAAMARVRPEIDKALADARAQLASSDIDLKVRESVDRALQRVVVQIEARDRHKKAHGRDTVIERSETTGDK